MQIQLCHAVHIWIFGHANRNLNCYLLVSVHLSSSHQLWIRPTRRIESGLQSIRRGGVETHPTPTRPLPPHEPQKKQRNRQLDYEWRNQLKHKQPQQYPIETTCVCSVKSTFAFHRIVLKPSQRPSRGLPGKPGPGCTGLQSLETQPHRCQKQQRRRGPTPGRIVSSQCVSGRQKAVIIQLWVYSDKRKMTYLLSESAHRKEAWKYFYCVVKIIVKSALISDATLPFIWQRAQTLLEFFLSFEKNTGTFTQEAASERVKWGQDH